MYDIIIVGSGPAGMTAAIYASRSGFRTAVVEKDFMGCGKLAVTEKIDNYPAMPKISGAELGDKFREHAQFMGGEYITACVKRITKTGNLFNVNLENSNFLQSRSVIYAAGTSPKKLNIEGSELSGIHYCASCDGTFYRNKAVAVIGGGNTALGEALYLSKIAKKVYVLNRSENLRGNISLRERAENTSNIKIIKNAVPKKILGKRSVEGILLLNDGKEIKINTDGIFTAIGSVPDTLPVSELCRLDGNGYIIAGEDGKTSAEGLFAAGDVRTKSLRQIITAASDGANCVKSAEDFLI